MNSMGIDVYLGSQWHTIRRLSHREDLERMARQPEDYNLHPLKRFYDWNPELRYG